MLSGISGSSTSGNGRHRRIRRSRFRTAMATTGAAGAALAAPLIGATSAHAASVSTWDKVAQCESGGNWSINTGNGYYGGLQFSASTWRAYGGGAYAATANHATKGQQITIGEKVLKAQGPQAWPVCGPRAGLERGGAPANVSATSGHKAKPKPKPKPKHGKPATHGAKYTVKRGDTLSGIAAAHHVKGGWRALWQANRATIGSNPNHLFVGEHLRLG